MGRSKVNYSTYWNQPTQCRHVRKSAILRQSAVKLHEIESRDKLVCLVFLSAFFGPMYTIYYSMSLNA
jgi:hypothetical protein